MRTFIKRLMLKNQGQSITEYLLLSLLASVFVFILFVQFSPPFKQSLQRLEIAVANKIAGGKLLSHPQAGSAVGVAQESSGGNINADAASQDKTGSLETASAGPGDAATGTHTSSGSGEGGGSTDAFLQADSTKKKETTIAGESTEGESGTTTGTTGGRLGGDRVLPSASDKNKTVSAQEEKKEKNSKSKGVLHSEGEEEALLRGRSFDWLKLLLILLIIGLIVYICFELFKGSRSIRKK